MSYAGPGFNNNYVTLAAGQPSASPQLTRYSLNQVTTGATALNGTDLGVFNPAIGAQLYLEAGESNTYHYMYNGGTVVVNNDGIVLQNVQLLYRLYPAQGSPGPFTALDLPFAQAGPSNTPNGQQWLAAAAHIDLLQLASQPGSYVLEVYVQAQGQQDGNTLSFADNQNGTNYKASFTVLPAAEGLVADSAELHVLHDFYRSTNGPQWATRTGWPVTDADWAGATLAQAASWYGVGVQGGDVVSLVQYNNDLSGQLPHSIGRLAALQTLNIQRYPFAPATTPGLGGTLPKELGQLHRLQILAIRLTEVEGAIPPELGNCHQLWYLSLLNNHLSGKIPPELGNLSQLTHLTLDNYSGSFFAGHRNAFTGGIPREFGKLTSLTSLALDLNPLGGSIPPELGQLTNLTYLEIEDAQLSGEVPAAILGLPNLTTLLLGYPNTDTPGTNTLSALPPPSVIANPAGLTLALSYNQFGFAALEPYFTGPGQLLTGLGSTYLPQFQPAQPEQSVSVATGHPLELPSGQGGTRTRYQWQRLVGSTWTSLPADTSRSLTRAAVAVSEAGRYRCQITNTWVTGLTLVSPIFVVAVGEGAPRNLPDDTNQGVALVTPTPAPDAMAPTPADMNFVRTWLPRVALTSAVVGAGGTPTPGSVLREQWDNVSGTDVSAIPLTTTPTSTSYLTALEGPSNIGDNYGDRIRGYLTAAQSGPNMFWVAAADNAELWLSTDEDPAHKQRIAFVPGATDPHQLNKYAEQQSTDIQLVAGQRYYLEILHKASTGIDHLDVAWRWPDGSFHDPAPGSALSPFVITSVPVAIDTPPTWTVDQASQSTQYLDGLGRPVQTVLHQASPGKYDLVQPQAYDALGREPRQYLPYPDSAKQQPGRYRPRALTQQAQFYARTGPVGGGPGPLTPGDPITGVARTGAAFGETLFEASPLNRVLAQGAPGEAWQLSAGQVLLTSHVQQRLERPNVLADSVPRFAPGYPPRQVDPGYQGYYADGELWGVQATDEQGNQTLAWKDRLGQVVCKQVEAGRTGSGTATLRRWLRTAYAYDDYGHLRVVLQPEASKRVLPLGNAPAAVPASIQAFMFHYRYDGRGRQVAKQVPGQDGETLVIYDQLDRPVLSQDASQRQRQEWSWTKYDALGRPVLTGLVTRADTAGQVTLQAIATADTTSTHQYEQRTADAGHYPLYYTTDQSFPQLGQQGFGVGQVLSVTNYDDYNFDNDAAGTADATYTTDFDWHFAQTGGIAPVADAGRTQGMMTQTKTRVLGVAENDPTYAAWLTTTTFYDERARPVQVQSTNARNRQDVLISQLDFTGKVVQSVVVHRGPDYVPLVVQEIFTYDHMGRPLTGSQQLPTEAHPTRLDSVNYNEMGQVTRKTIGTGLLRQDVDYAYNIRGWLTRLNDPYSPNTTDLFNLSLHYEQGFTTGYEQYNGNLTGQTWRGRDGVQRAYGYIYDPVNRLQQGDFVARQATTAATPNAGAWTAEQDNYRLSFVSYDDNGNILTLRRRGLLQNATHATVKQYGDVDSLTYAYQGNRLRAVDDAVTSNQLPRPKNYNGAPTSLAGDFQEQGVKLGEEYLYDANGNLTQDKNKGITNIVYNHLNLPRQIHFGQVGDSVVFRYTASGQKVAKLVYQTGKPMTRTDYLGPYQYEQDSLKFFPHAEGRVLRFVSGTSGAVSYQREFTIKDQLGNLRLAYRLGQVRTLTATLEQDATTHKRETQQFDSLSVSPPVAVATTLARSGGWAAKLNAGGTAPQPLGPLTQLGVQKGDTVTVTAYGYYPQAQQHGFLFSLASFITGILHPSSSPPAGMEASPRKDLPLLQVGLSAGLASIPQLSGGVPLGYLRLLVFNKDSVLVANQPSPVQLTQVANGGYEKLRVQVIVPQDGYITTYVGSQSDVDVFFDDMSVEHRPGLQVQENQYEPWGLSLAGLDYAAPGIQGLNKYQFNGKERQLDLGLGLSDYGARFYDPARGPVWYGLDLLADVMNSWSPYVFSMDNPVRYTDMTGMIPDLDSSDPEPLVAPHKGFQPKNLSGYIAQGGPGTKVPTVNGVLQVELPGVTVTGKGTGPDWARKVVNDFQSEGYFSSNPAVRPSQYCFTPNELNNSVKYQFMALATFAGGEALAADALAGKLLAGGAGGFTIRSVADFGIQLTAGQLSGKSFGKSARDVNFVEVGMAGFGCNWLTLGTLPNVLSFTYENKISTTFNSKSSFAGFASKTVLGLTFGLTGHTIGDAVTEYFEHVSLLHTTGNGIGIGIGMAVENSVNEAGTTWQNKMDEKYPDQKDAH